MEPLSLGIPPFALLSLELRIPKSHPGYWICFSVMYFIIVWSCFFKGSKRGRVKNNMYHTYPANFSGIQPLPPIQNSLEGNMGGGGDFMWPTPPPKQGTGPPVITMEPPTPQHPLLSGKSKFSQGWSSRSKTLSKSSVQCEFIRRLYLVYIESMLFH